MSTQYAPQEVGVDADLVDDVIDGLRRRAAHFVRADDEAGPRFRVAPANADHLAASIEEAKRAKQRAEEESLQELRASIDVGGLNLEQAERLVSMIKGAGGGQSYSARDLPEDLQRALGIGDPEHEATFVVRFERSARPQQREVQQWVHAALSTYFNEHEQFCGITRQDPQARDVIKSVRVTEVVSVGD